MPALGTSECSVRPFQGGLWNHLCCFLVTSRKVVAQSSRTVPQDIALFPQATWEFSPKLVWPVTPEERSWGKKGSGGLLPISQREIEAAIRLSD